jgi:hypothetical protein
MRHVLQAAPEPDQLSDRFRAPWRSGAGRARQFMARA